MLLLNDDEGEGCSQKFSTSANRVPSAIAVKCQSLAVPSMRVLIDCATGRVNREDVWARLVNASLSEVD